MKKLLIFPIALMALFTFDSCKNKDQERELQELRALAEMDRREMENQYEQFALQYDELKKGIKDDSLISQLEAERQRTAELLEELRRTKQNDAAEIRRLKQELETVRAVLRTFVIQVDSLTRENGRLTNERDEARALLGDAHSQINSLSNERERLSDKVAIAAQLNATGISINAVKKSGKKAKRVKDTERFEVSFTISRNVTASTGVRPVYVRLMNPSGGVVNPSVKVNYESKSLDCSASKSVEYTGEELPVSLVVPASNSLLNPGKYSVHIFCDGQMIGSSSVTLEK